MYVYMCVRACMCVCVHVCMYICMYVCTYVCRYVCMYVCVYVCKGCHLVVVERFVFSNEPQSYVAWSLVLLAGRSPYRVTLEGHLEQGHPWGPYHEYSSPGISINQKVDFIILLQAYLFLFLHYLIFSYFQIHKPSLTFMSLCLKM